MKVHRNHRIAWMLILILGMSGLSVHAAQIGGTVWDYYGTTALEGITVQCLEYTGSDTQIYSGQSGPDGRFRVDLPAGTYLVAANGNGSNGRSISQFYGGVNWSSYAVTIQVEDSAPVTSADFYLWAGYRVSGRVAAVSGTGLDTTLMAYDHTTGYYYWGMTGFSSRSADGGAFSGVLPQGVYTFFAVDAAGAMGELSPVIIDDDTTDITITVPVTAVISGQVTAADASPVSGIRIDALDAGNGYSYGYAVTGDNGEYAIGNLDIDRDYLILARTRFHAEGLYADSPGTFYPGVTDPEQAGRLSLGASGRSGIDFSLAGSPGTISGRVTNRAGDPIANATVYDFYYPGVLNPYVAISQRVTETDADGRYQLTGLGACRMGVSVVATDYVPQIWDHQDQTTLLDAGTSIDLSAGETVDNIDFSLMLTDDLADPPVATSIHPHLVRKGTTRTVTVTGTDFADGLSAGIVDLYPAHLNGEFPVIQSTRVVSAEQVDITIATTESTAAGAYFLAITNPDGNYTMPGFAVIDSAADVQISILASPERFTTESTWSIGWNMNNLTDRTRVLDVYLGLLLPTGDVVFSDGTTFSMDPMMMFDAHSFPADFFQAQNLLFEIPMNGADLPAGEYLWVIVATEPGTFDVVDLSTKRQVLP